MTLEAKIDDSTHNASRSAPFISQYEVKELDAWNISHLIKRVSKGE